MRPHSPLSRRLFLLDLAMAAVGFYLGTVVRQALPWGFAALSSDIPFPPLMVYGMVIFSWSVALLVQGVYEPERVVRWHQETTRLITASLMATILRLSNYPGPVVGRPVRRTHVAQTARFPRPASRYSNSCDRCG